jgi:hypothetical protein
MIAREMITPKKIDMQIRKYIFLKILNIDTMDSSTKRLKMNYV